MLSISLSGSGLLFLCWLHAGSAAVVTYVTLVTCAVSLSYLSSATLWCLQSRRGVGEKSCVVAKPCFSALLLLCVSVFCYYGDQRTGRFCFLCVLPLPPPPFFTVIQRKEGQTWNTCPNVLILILLLNRMCFVGFELYSYDQQLRGSSIPSWSSCISDSAALKEAVL